MAAAKALLTAAGLLAPKKSTATEPATSSSLLQERELQEREKSTATEPATKKRKKEKRRKKRKREEEKESKERKKEEKKKRRDVFISAGTGSSAVDRAAGFRFRGWFLAWGQGFGEVSRTASLDG